MKDKNVLLDVEQEQNTSRREWLKFAGMGAALGVLGTTAAQAAKPQPTEPEPEPTTDPAVIDSGLVNVKDPQFGAVGDGQVSDSDAFQLAINFAQENGKGGIYIPPGQYLLSTPVEVGNYVTIIGFGGDDYDANQGTVILPATVAFMPKPIDGVYAAQRIGFTCKNMVFSGGTIPIDLGLRHSCIFRDLSFLNPSKAAISIVRGERHEFTNVKIYARNVDCEYGLALATASVTTVPGITNVLPSGETETLLGEVGPWVDRVSADLVVFLHSAGTFLNAIYCEGLLSNFNSHNIICHGVSGHVLYVGTRLQFSSITNLLMDNCSTTESLIHIQKCKQVVFTDVSPGSSGNNVYNTGIYIVDSDLSVFINCNVKKANSDIVPSYGLRFGNNGGQSITLIGCRGDLTHESKNLLQQNRITQINCVWYSSSTDGSAGLSSSNDKDITMQLMADSTGVNPATGSFKIVSALGLEGRHREILDASLDSVTIGSGSFDGVLVKFGSRYEWYDDDGNKRAKVGRPVTHDDGDIISLNRII